MPLHRVARAALTNTQQIARATLTPVQFGQFKAIVGSREGFQTLLGVTGFRIGEYAQVTRKLAAADAAT